MKNIYPYLLLLCTLFAGNYTANAQCDPVLRPDSTHLVFNGTVNTSARVGNILYVGGNFSRVGQNTGGFVKVDGLNTGNPLNLANWPKINGGVNTIVSDGSGGWIIGGTFTQVGTFTRNRIAQINAAGQVTAWDPNASGQVMTLYRSGTTLYVGGFFVTISGQSRNRIASYDLTTGNITSWNPNADNPVYAITVSGATVYAGGTFATIGGQARNRIAALDATGAATSWNPDVSAGTSVNRILVNSGIVYFGGAFTTVGGQGRNSAASADVATGTVTNWNPSPNGTVTDMAVNGTNIILSGTFNTIGSLSRVGVGEVDNNLGNATSRNFNLPTANINTIKISGNYIYIGGTFTIASSGQANLVRANLTTNTIDPWQSNFNSAVIALDVNGNDLYVAGSFSQHYYNRSNIVAIDWVTDTVIPTFAPTVNSTVNAIAADAFNVYIGGSFTVVNGVSRSRLALLNTLGVLDAWNPLPNNIVYSLALSGSTLYLGGAFTTIGSLPRTRLAAYDIPAHTLSTWNPGIGNGQVQAMVVNGTNIYVGGTFTSAGPSPGTPRNRLAAFVTATGALTAWNPNADGNVTSLAISGSTIYSGGAFINIGPQQAPRLAAIDISTGLASSTWIPFPNNTVNSIAIDGSSMYVGGAFTTIGGQSRSNLAALTLSTGAATTWNPAPNSTCNHVAVYGDRLLVGGLFTAISGQSATPYGAQYNLLATTPVVNITGNNSVCAATSVTYTAITAVAGATYQWKKNSLNVGTGATYITIPVNGDQIQCVITVPGGSCYTSPTATSNTITVSVTAPVNPVISVTGNTTVCLATATTYTATTNITGGILQWKVNGNNTGTNSTSFTYIPSNGDVVTCTVTAPAAGCYSPASATSAPLNITVNVPVLPTISITSPKTTICANESITFTAATNVTGGTYQWKVNNINAGTNSNTFTTTALTNGASVTCVITTPAGGCYTTGTVTSNAIVMTVTSNTTPGITISGNLTPCGTAATTYTATTNVTGGTYQWKVNGINAGTNSNTYAYSPAANDVVTCQVTAAAGTCYSPMSANSNALVIVPKTPVVATATVSGSNNICAGQSGTYVASTNVVGGASYQWKVNGVNAGTNSGIYTYTPVNGDIVTCVITTPVSGCYTTSTVTSNNFTVTVNSPVLPTITITTPATTVCSGVPVTFDGTNNNVPGGSYQWRVNGFDVWGEVNSTFTYFPSNGDVVTCAITVPFGGCYLVTTSYSNPITMTVTPSITPTIGILASANNVCMGTVVNFTANTNITGGSYQWKVNGVNVGTNANNYSYSPVTGDVVSCQLTVPGTGCFTVGFANSNLITMQVTTPVTPNITVVADKDTTCEGSNVTLTATTNITGGTFLWKVNGFNAGTNSSIHSYVPQNNDIILCTIITPPGCYTVNTATSQLKVLKVKPKQPVSFAVGAAPIVELGGTVYVHAVIPSGITNYSIEWKRNGTTYATTTTNTSSYIKTQGIDTLTAVLTTADGCYNPGTSPAIYVYSVGTGINDAMKSAGIEVYPNPFSDRITVKGVSITDKLILFDMAGRNIMPAIIRSNAGATLMFNDIAPGAYLLKVITDDGQVKVNIPLRKM